ncbi:hypothetical protein [Stenotrophomonas maltophilia]|uniref:hypothetical protein n=1 Tax=Stenotrophomonas maltophilia TaxID=40324 RepID=UPI0021C63803|nr:hypothetical protein [Stenotrophomonas maltophilia]MCU1063050.1 hypothetical protein [Stenotrophomonas maltophilia]
MKIWTTMLAGLSCVSAGCTPHGRDNHDLDAYRNGPPACSASGYLAALAEPARLAYLRGALQVRPRSPCIAELLAAQPPAFLKVARQAILDGGERSDLPLLVGAVAMKVDRGEITAAQVDALQLQVACTDSPGAPVQCVEQLRHLRQALQELEDPSSRVLTQKSKVYLSGASATRRVEATLAMRTADAPAASGVVCGGTTSPCREVTHLELRVDGRPVPVAYSVYRDLFDLHRGTLKADAGGGVLDLQGGDASESYNARIRFDAQRVLSRQVYAGTAQDDLLQETVYYEVIYE